MGYDQAVTVAAFAISILTPNIQGKKITHAINV